MEKVKNDSEGLNYLKKVHNIAKKMGWKIIDVYKKLEVFFNQKENFDFPTEDAFRKQYNLKGKGSKQHFKKYYDYLYNLEEVKDKLTESNSITTLIKNNIYAIIIIFFISMLMIILTEIYPQYNSFYKLRINNVPQYKECKEKCFKEYEKDIPKSSIQKIFNLEAYPKENL